VVVIAAGGACFSQRLRAHPVHRPPRAGDNSMHRALRTMLADIPLVKNLSNSDCIQFLFDGRPHIEAPFTYDVEPAELDPRMVLETQLR